MTTQTVADLLLTQNKVARLAAKARDLQREIKYCEEDLKKLASGFYEQCLANDPEFVTRNTKRQTDARDFKTGQLSVYLEQIAELNASRTPVEQLPHADLLKFFQGTGLEAAQGGLELLALCLEHGGWVPGASRRIESVLSPAKAAKKTRAAYEQALAPLAKQFKLWSATRPKPTFTTIGLSPTVTATLKSLGASNVAVCEIDWKLVEVKVGAKTTYHWVGTLLWPAGIKHGTSQYRGTCNNSQCEACGHAIKNSFNWVPLILTTPEGPKSLWVGRDCAKNLFGIELEGELELVEGSR